MGNELRNKVQSILFSLIIASISLMVIIRQMGIPTSDVALHSEWAYKIHSVSQIFKASSYPLYHIIVKIMVKVTCIPLNYCAALVMAGCNLFTYGILHRYIVRKNEKNRSSNVFNYLILGMMLAQAIYVPWFNERLYLGQGSINVWHNPTYTIVKPFAILAFGLLEDIYADTEKRKVIFSKRWWLLLIVMFFANLAKPSLFQVLVPGLGLFMLFDLITLKGKQIVKHVEVAAAFIPSAALALYQAGVSFTTGVSLEWLGVWKEYSPNPYISVVLFIAFPLFVLSSRIKEWNNGIKIALCVFLTGFFETALLAEEGFRRNHGNFFWGYYLGGALVWLVSVKEFIRWHRSYFESGRNDKITSIKLTMGWILFLLHVFSGIYYIYLLLFSPGFLN
ncbi:MAG: hypothetical protein UFG06_11545 [Lachnospiraceae bacterium]|nr:hypothetical protein [Lachnospiraceae bacterium]